LALPSLFAIKAKETKGNGPTSGGPNVPEVLKADYPKRGYIMRKSILIAAALLAACGGSHDEASSHLQNVIHVTNTAQYTCHSIDVTHRPFYTLEVGLFSPTHPGYYYTTINRSSTLANDRITTLRREGKGFDAEIDSLSISYGIYSNGLWQPSGETLTITTLANGFIKGELALNDAPYLAELSCNEDL